MGQRINLTAKGQRAMKALYGIAGYLAQSSLERNLLELVYFRVSQMNGCAFCLDMHAKELRAKGETEQRLFVVNAWREAPFYTQKERAALAWAEAVTNVTGGAVADDVYAEACKHFSEVELVDLTLAVTTINTYNRFNIAFGAPVGTYQVNQYSEAN